MNGCWSSETTSWCRCCGEVVGFQFSFTWLLLIFVPNWDGSGNVTRSWRRSGSAESYSVLVKNSARKMVSYQRMCLYLILPVPVNQHLWHVDWGKNSPKLWNEMIKLNGSADKNVQFSTTPWAVLSLKIQRDTTAPIEHNGITLHILSLRCCSLRRYTL